MKLHMSMKIFVSLQKGEIEYVVFSQHFQCQNSSFLFRWYVLCHRTSIHVRLIVSLIPSKKSLYTANLCISIKVKLKDFTPTIKGSFLRNQNIVKLQINMLCFSASDALKAGHWARKSQTTYTNRFYNHASLQRSSPIKELFVIAHLGYTHEEGTCLTLT